LGNSVCPPIVAFVPPATDPMIADAANVGTTPTITARITNREKLNLKFLLDMVKTP
jgi:hypothetical protein